MTISRQSAATAERPSDVRSDQTILCLEVLGVERSASGLLDDRVIRLLEGNPVLSGIRNTGDSWACKELGLVTASCQPIAAARTRRDAGSVRVPIR